MHSKFALPAAATLLQAASAQILYGADAGSLSSDTWSSVIESANYTDSQSVAGRDLSATYPGSEQDGWSLSFAIKDGVAGSGETKTPAGAISLSGPSSDFDDSWHLCLHVFPVRPASAGGAWSTDFDGTCSGSVATECLDDLKKNALSNFGKDCKTWSLTASCLRDIQDNRLNTAAVSVTADNHQDFIGNETSFYREVFADEILTAALEPRAVVSVWGRSADSGEDPTIQITCLKPDTVASGSTDPGAPEGAASGLKALASWAVLTAAVALQLL
ncbi:hypothetical protein V2G26_009906 [Clonostachys chloroleuca]